LKPSGSEENTYDRDAIIAKLKALEKDVVQFQIDYKKIVFEQAGEHLKELKEVMSNISTKGLELTKWLRGFVHYVMERRDLEQELLDYCGAEDAQGWTAWFENLGKSMSAGQSLLLLLIGRLFYNNVCQTALQFAPTDQVEEPTEPAKSTEENQRQEPTESEEKTEVPEANTATEPENNENETTTEQNEESAEEETALNIQDYEEPKEQATPTTTKAAAKETKTPP
jgi:hypothetical protein